jgi:hypothetical protein
MAKLLDHPRVVALLWVLGGVIGLTAAAVTATTVGGRY